MNSERLQFENPSGETLSAILELPINNAFVDLFATYTGKDLDPAEEQQLQKYRIEWK